MIDKKYDWLIIAAAIMAAIYFILQIKNLFRWKELSKSKRIEILSAPVGIFIALVELAT